MPIFTLNYFDKMRCNLTLHWFFQGMVWQNILFKTFFNI